MTIYLIHRCNQALDGKPLAQILRSKAKAVDWPQFYVQWQQSYRDFASSYKPEAGAFKTVDEHYHDSLRDLIKQHGVDGLWTEDEIQDINKIWHRLNPWPDSSKGVDTLKFAGISNVDSFERQYVAIAGSLRVWVVAFCGCDICGGVWGL